MQSVNKRVLLAVNKLIKAMIIKLKVLILYK